MPIAASCERPAGGGMARHTRDARVRRRDRSTTRSRRCAPIPARAAVLLDVDGTLAPIVRHADDAHVPEPTRVAADRGRQALRRSSPASAAAARRPRGGSSRSARSPTSATTAPSSCAAGATSAEVDPDVAAVGAARVRAFADERAGRDELHRLRVRAEDKDVIAAFHWRGAPDEEAAEAAVRDVAAARRGSRASSRTGAARCSRSARRSRSTRAAASRRLLRRAPTSTSRSTPATTAPTSTRSAALRDAGRRRAAAARRSASACAPTRRRPSSRREADLARRRPARRARALLEALAADARMRFVDFLRATVLLSAGAATTLAVVTALGRRATTDEDDGSSLMRRRLVGAWPRSSALCARPPRAQVNPPIARLLAERQGGDDDARAPARAPSIAQPPVAAAAAHVVAAGALAFLAPQIPGIAAGFTIIWALAWRRQDARGRGDRGARRRDVLRRARPRRSGRSSSSACPASAARCRRSTASGQERSTSADRAAGAKTSAGRKLPTLTSLDVEQLERDPDDQHAAGAGQRRERLAALGEDRARTGPRPSEIAPW